jgi:hypothetical protein
MHSCAIAAFDKNETESCGQVISTLLRIPEVPGSDLDPETRYPE